MVVDPRDCQIESIARKPVDTTLHLHSAHAKTGLHFKLTVELPRRPDSVSMSLEMIHSGPAPRRVMVAFPYLTGLALGEDRSTNRGVHLRGWGKAGGPAWTDLLSSNMCPEIIRSYTVRGTPLAILTNHTKKLYAPIRADSCEQFSCWYREGHNTGGAKY